jgi:hypothetical protein
VNNRGQALHRQLIALAMLPLSLAGSGPAYAGQEQAQAQEQPPTASEDTRNCLNTRRIRRVRALDEKNVLFYVSNRTIFLNILQQGCAEIRQFGQISYRTTTGNLCEGDSLAVPRSDAWGALRLLPNCKLGTFRKLSADEVQVVRDVERGRVEPTQPMRPDRVEIGVVKDESEQPES